MIDWFAAINVPTLIAAVVLSVFCTEAVRRAGRAVVGLFKPKAG